MGTEKRFQLDYAVHPGEYLEELLQVNNMSQRELADRTHITTKHINLVINGKANITAKTAIALESVLQRSARYWLELQASYDEFCERRERIAELERNTEWIRMFDYREMVKRNYAEPAKDDTEKGANLLSFFQVSSVEAWHRTWKTNAIHIYCRSGAKTGVDVQEKSIARLSQWIRMGQIDAQEKVENYPSFNPAILEKSLQEIRALNVITDAQRLIFELSERLKDAGVLIQFIKEISGMRTYGTSFMARNNEVACIQLCLRGRTNDQLWFSLLHEVYHLLNRGNSKGFLIGHTKDEEAEKQADEFARNLLIPKVKYHAFLSRGVYNAQAIMVFAQENQIHAGIVVGRLQHDQIIAFHALNHLKVKYQWAEESAPA